MSKNWIPPILWIYLRLKYSEDYCTFLLPPCVGINLLLKRLLMRIVLPKYANFPYNCLCKVAMNVAKTVKGFNMGKTLNLASLWKQLIHRRICVIEFMKLDFIYVFEFLSLPLYFLAKFMYLEILIDFLKKKSEWYYFHKVLIYFIPYKLSRFSFKTWVFIILDANL